MSSSPSHAVSRVVAVLLLALLCLLSFAPVQSQLAPPTSTSAFYNYSFSPVPPLQSFTPFTPNFSLTDDGVDQFVPIGFSFVFYNVSYTNLNVGANGDLQFQTSSTSWTPAVFGSGNSALTPVIAFFYTDLYPYAIGTRSWAVLGTAPRRQFFLRYTQVPFCCSSTGVGLSADIILYETSNVIEIRYYNVIADGTHSVDVGLENAAVNGAYDSLAVVNDVLISSATIALLTNMSLTFTPITPFVNPAVYGTAATGTALVAINSTSTVYGVTGPNPAPLPTSFAPAGTLAYTDNDVAAVSLGFNFTFYGISYSQAYVSANGNLQFQTGTSTQYPYAFASTSNLALGPFIAFFYSDLYPIGAPASRTFATIGTAPNRQFILRYQSVPYTVYVGSPFSPLLSCDVLLYETSNAIEFRYYGAGPQNAYYYVDIGISNTPGLSYDFLAVANYITLSAGQALGLVNTSYTFTPLQPFTNPTGFGGFITPPPVYTTSAVYNASLQTAPAPVSFTPAGILPYTDNDVTRVQLPFNFTFYGFSYSQVYVSSNGNLQFRTGSGYNYPYGFATTSNTVVVPMIAFFYADLLPTAAPASRTYATLGTAPNRIWILRYANVPLQTYISGGLLTCDVLLYETSNQIEFRYYQVPAFAQSYYLDVGIVNSLVGSTYDYVSVINYQTATAPVVNTMVNTSYVFTPLQPFVNPQPFSVATPMPTTTTSTVYTGMLGAAPAPVSFTPSGTLPYTDDGVTAAPLGFNFTYYGISYSQVYVSANGNVQFQTAATTGSPSAFGASVAASSPIIAFFWSDLVPLAAPASRTFATMGTAPNRMWILRYTSVPLQTYISGGQLSADVLLYESINAVEFRYYAVPSFSLSYYYVSVGLQNAIYGNAYDYIAVLNYVNIAATISNTMINTSYTFTPITPFLNPPTFTLSAPNPVTYTSAVYGASHSPAIAPVTFTPSATLPYTDNDVTAVPIGFNFTFYNFTYTTVYVAANGNLQFQSASSSNYPYQWGSSNSALGAFIAFFYADLLPSAAPSVRTYATMGTAPNRIWILRYQNVGLQTYISTGLLSCDVLLYETSNNIEFRYYQVPSFLYTYYYVDIGLQNIASPTFTYDYVSVVNYLSLPTTIAAPLTNTSYLFYPLAPFLNPTRFVATPPVPVTSTSTVYNATLGTAPAPVTFTPTATLPYVDNDVTAVPLGFNFTFYGVSYSSVFVGANGNLQFQTTSTATYPYSLGTSSNAALSPMIAFFYTDLVPTGAPSTRTYATTGTAPNRVWILRYANVASQTYISTQLLSCDVLLHEGTNQIELRYYQVPSFLYTYYYVDIGIQNSVVGTAYDAVSIVNYQSLQATTAAAMVNVSYSITPIVPFVNPPYFQFGAPIPVTTTSTVYNATLGSAPAPVAFTPSATLPYTDNDVTRAPIGFNFTFYNVSYQYLYVAANGNLQFQTGSTTTYPYTLGTSSNSASSPMIAFFFADLLPSAAPASRTYATTGTAPNRIWILRYSNVGLQTYIATQLLSCDVLLYETSNQIVFRYYQVPAFISPYYYLDIGLQNAALPGTFTYDSVSVVNYGIPGAPLATALTNASYTFTPFIPFTNPSTFTVTAPQPVFTLSTVYNATLGVAPAPVAFTPAATLPYDNDGVTTVPLSFNFTFYGTTYSSVVVASNGNLQFRTGSTSYYPYSFGTSSNSALGAFIAFFYADLLPSAAPSVRTYATMGTAPNRVWILRLSNVGLQTYISTGLLSCDVLLYETSNQIEFRYYQVPAWLYTYYYLDVGIANAVQGTSYDYVSVINDGSPSASTAAAMVNASYVFSPVAPFVNPTFYNSFAPPAPVTSTSSVYNGTAGTAPAPVAFTPTGTLPYDDNGLTSVPLGINFTFYNVSYTSAFIGSNGNIQFSTLSTSASPSSFGSAEASLSPFIAFFFTDLVPNAAPAVRTYGTIGTAPNRQFILRYSNVPSQTYITGGLLSCDVLLYETSNAIELRYYQVPAFLYYYYYVDIGFQNSVSSNVYDSVSIVNYQSLSALTATQLTNASYMFTPFRPFTNPRVYTITPVPASSSSTYFASYGAAPPALNFIPTAYLPFEDNDVHLVQLGFSFTFYGYSYAQLYVGSNGELQFQTSYDDYTPLVFGSGLATMSPLIAFFYSDLDPIFNTGSRSYATIGTAPNRQFVLRYVNIAMNPSISAGTLSVDVLLNETSNAIEFRYYAVPTFSSSSYYADIGIENASNTTTYDWISVVSRVSITSFTALGLTGTAYQFRPTTPFVNPTPFTSIAPTILSTSSVYTVASSTVPAMVSLGANNGSSLPLTDNDVTSALLGFNFVFYGVSYSQVFISPNGNLQFQTASPAILPYTFSSSSNAALGPFIAFYYTDLFPTTTASSRSFATIGSAPNRQFIVRYTLVPFQYLQTVPAVSCDVVLTETANTVELRYYQVAPVPYTTYYVDMGISSGNVSDYISLVNDLPLSAGRALGLQGKSFTFSPISAFSSSLPYAPTPFNLVANSTSYSASISTSVVAPVAFTPITTPALSLTNDGVDTAISLGFTFVFYNIPYTNVTVGANGNLQFQTTSTLAVPGLFGTGDAALAPFIAFFYADLYPMGGGSRSYGTIGTAPNRQFVLRLTHVSFCCTILNFAGLSMDVVLTETSNAIEFRYYNVPTSTSNNVDIGIENSVNNGWDWISLWNDVPMDGVHAAVLSGSTITFVPGTSTVITPPTTPSSSTGAVRVTSSTQGSSSAVVLPSSAVVRSSSAAATSALATSAPATSALATSVLTTSALATSAPATSALATSTPATSAALHSSSVTSAPATSALATSAPATSALATSAPATSAPVTSALRASSSPTSPVVAPTSAAATSTPATSPRLITSAPATSAPAPAATSAIVSPTSAAAVNPLSGSSSTAAPASGGGGGGSSGLSGGAIAGIVIGSVAGLALLCVICLLAMSAGRREKADGAPVKGDGNTAEPSRVSHVGLQRGRQSEESRMGQQGGEVELEQV